MDNVISAVFRSLLILTLGFIVFGGSLSHGFLPYDDNANILANEAIKKGLTLEGLTWAFGIRDDTLQLAHQGVLNLWHPLTWISHMVDVSLFGLEGAWGHHLTGLSLHLLGGLFLMLVVWRLMSSWNLAFFIAALWLVHPLKVESAVWISERKDVLSGAFFWASLLCMVWIGGAPSRLRSGLGFWCFLFAILGKPSVVVLPILLILLEGIRSPTSFDSERWTLQFWKRGLTRYWAWFLLSAVASAVTIYMQMGGTLGETAGQSSLLSRLFPQAVAMGFYIWRFMVPLDLSIDYPEPDLPNWVFAGAWVLLITGLAFTWCFRRKSPALFFGVAWWCVCLLPVSGLVYVGTSFTTDRYLYLASAGPLLAAGLYLRDWDSRHPNWADRGVLGIGGAVSGVLLIAWSFLSFQQTKVWENGWTLFTQVTEAQPRSALGWSNLGSMHLQGGNLEAAESSFLLALERDPQDYIAWYNLGLIAEKSLRGDAAIRAYQRALSLKPSYLPALKNLGIIQLKGGRYREGLTLLLDGSRQVNDSSPELLILAAEAALQLGERETAQTLILKVEDFSTLSSAHRRGLQSLRSRL